MTEHTEKDVLMKCTKCGYEEEVPRWLVLCQDLRQLKYLFF